MWDQVERALNDSTTRMITSVARLLPGVLALVVAVLVAALVAWIVRVLLRRSLLSIHFDDRMLQWSGGTTAEWAGSQSPTLARHAMRFLADHLCRNSGWHLRF